MKTLPAYLVLLALVLCCLTPSARAEHNLANFDPGDHVTGPKFSGKQIKGKVVVIEYWGITCGPCLAAIPHTTELAKKYGHDKLVIIANQSWSASNKNTKETWNNRAKNDMVMVVNGGELKGYKTSSVPRALIFDHTGKSIWEGHPGGMDQALAEAIANLPEREEAPAEEESSEAKEQASGPAAIIAGITPEFFEVEINRINAQNRNVASTLDKLRRATERASDQAMIDEAKAILAAVETWAKQQQATIDASRESDPATAYATAEALVDLLRGDDLAKQAGVVMNEIRKDGKLFTTVRATLLLRGVQAEAKLIGLDKDKSVAEDKDHTRTVRLIQRDLGVLIKDFPDTDAGKQAKTLQAQWGLDQ